MNPLLRTFGAMLLLLVGSPLALKAQNFNLHSNGVTVECTAAAVGDTGTINGVEYTKRTAGQITEANAATTCTSGITDMYQMFYQASTFNGDISSWDVSSVTDMSYMFFYASAFNGDISKWDVSSVTNMSDMFAGADAFNGDISKWDVSSVTDMSYMFYYASAFNGDISKWDVSSVTNMYAMFFYADAFNGDISKWDVSSVTNMSDMFSRADAFNGDISKWDVSSVTNMNYMFWKARTFNQDLSSWCVSNITSAPTNFGNAGTDPVWGTCPITSNQLDEKPLVFGLDQNYPNPFNPSTTINYSIKEAGAVTINVYNAMGQKVATLVNEMKTVGNYTARWNAASHASGMYYYRLEANGQAITQKMTLIK